MFTFMANAQAHGHDVIVIGASAGGIEALTTIVAKLPADLPAAETTVLKDLNDAVAVDLAVQREDTSSWGKSLYRKEPAKRAATKARFVPYHLWDNRAPGEMLVWLQSEK